MTVGVCSPRGAKAGNADDGAASTQRRLTEDEVAAGREEIQVQKPKDPVCREIREPGRSLRDQCIDDRVRVGLTAIRVEPVGRERERGSRHYGDAEAGAQLRAKPPEEVCGFASDGDQL